MAEASFNAAGTDDLPPIVMAADDNTGIVEAVVETREEDTVFVGQEYIRPGINGALAGAPYRLEPVDIEWLIHVVFRPTWAGSALAALSAFEDRFLSYPPGARYRLVSECGIQWDSVEFESYERLKLHRVGGADENGQPEPHELRIARVRFKWKVPLYFVEDDAEYARMRSAVFTPLRGRR